MHCSCWDSTSSTKSWCSPCPRYGPNGWEPPRVNKRSARFSTVYIKPTKVILWRCAIQKQQLIPWNMSYQNCASCAMTLRMVWVTIRCTVDLHDHPPLPTQSANHDLELVARPVAARGSGRHDGDPVEQSGAGGSSSWVSMKKYQPLGDFWTTWRETRVNDIDNYYGLSMIVTMISTYKLLYDVCIVSPHIASSSRSEEFFKLLSLSPCLGPLDLLTCDAFSGWS